MKGEIEMDVTGLDPITRLNKDIKEAASTLTAEQARYLVDYYYITQEDRKRADNQVRSMTEEPHAVLAWLASNARTFEGNIKSALQSYGANFQHGRWALSVHGIGPVITAGLQAHVDMDRCPSPSSLWRFAGLDPTSKWAKKQKRPWNAKLKVLCWHIGECFKRTSGSENSFYGPVYRKRKELEVERNERGDFEELAARTLTEKNWNKSTDAYAAYSKGLLPAGRLDLRATRYAAKLFLSHYWAIRYECERGEKPPPAWILTQDNHVHLIAPPNWPAVE